MKRLLSMLLCVVMVVTMVPGMAWAESTQEWKYVDSVEGLDVSEDSVLYKFKPAETGYYEISGPCEIGTGDETLLFAEVYVKNSSDAFELAANNVDIQFLENYSIVFVDKGSDKSITPLQFVADTTYVIAIKASNIELKEVNINPLSVKTISAESVPGGAVYDINAYTHWKEFGGNKPEPLGSTYIWKGVNIEHVMVAVEPNANYSFNYLATGSEETEYIQISYGNEDKGSYIRTYINWNSIADNGIFTPVFAFEGTQEEPEVTPAVLTFSDVAYDQNKAISDYNLSVEVKLEANTPAEKYLYFAVMDDNNNYVSITPYESSSFRVNYIVGDYGAPSQEENAGAGLSMVPTQSTDDPANKFVISVNPEAEPGFDAGYKRYDVWAVADESIYLVYNSIVSVKSGSSEDTAGEQRLVFSDYLLLDAGGELIEDAPIENAPVSGGFEINIAEGEGDTVSASKYAYIGTYENNVLTKLERVPEGLTARYINGFNGDNPNFVGGEASGITVVQGDDTTYYTFTVTKSAFNNFAEGSKKYDVIPSNVNNVGNATIRIVVASGDEDQGGGNNNSQLLLAYSLPDDEGYIDFFDGTLNYKADERETFYVYVPKELMADDASYYVEYSSQSLSQPITGVWMRGDGEFPFEVNIDGVNYFVYTIDFSENLAAVGSNGWVAFGVEGKPPVNEVALKIFEPFIKTAYTLPVNGQDFFYVDNNSFEVSFGEFTGDSRKIYVYVPTAVGDVDEINTFFMGEDRDEIYFSLVKDDQNAPLICDLNGTEFYAFEATIEKTYKKRGWLALYTDSQFPDIEYNYNINYSDDTSVPSSNNWNYAVIKNNDYVFLQNSGPDDYVEAGMFFYNELETDTFYIMLRRQNESMDHDMLNYWNRDTGEEFKDSELTVTPNGFYTDAEDNEHIVWKVVVKNITTFDRWRMRCQVNGSWNDALFLGKDYVRAGAGSGFSNMIPMKELPVQSEWDDFSSFYDAQGENGNRTILEGNHYLNMSKSVEDDRNSFYILHTCDFEDLDWNVNQYIAYVYGGTELSSGAAGRFAKKLNDNVFNVTPISERVIKIKNGEGYDEYKVAKVNLSAFQGHENLLVTFYDRNDNTDWQAKFQLSMGMDIRIKATDEDTDALEGLKHIKDGHNALMEALGFAPVTDGFEFVKNSDGSYSAFFDKALATFSEEGQGYQCGLDIQLKPGYVINNITSKNGRPYNFSIENRYYYDVTDKNGLKRDNFQLRSETGWFAGIGNQGKENYMVQHVLASYGDLEKSRTAGFETVSAFKAFLEGTAKNEDNPWGENFRNDLAPYTAELTGTYTDYTFDFAKELRTSQNEIVIEISKAEFGEDVGTSGGNADVEITVGDKVFTEEELAAGNVLLHKLYSNGNTDWYITKAYEITETGGDGEFDGFINITIPRSEFKGNHENFEVYYFTGGGVPVKLETAYTEKGLVFMTGHFSTYAVVSTEAEDDDDDDGNDSTGDNSGTTGGYIPVTPSAPKNEVTNTTGTTTTVPTTNADMSQSTTMKGNETTTTVDQTVADKIVENAVANKSEEVVIDATYHEESSDQSTKAATVEVPAETIQQIAEQTEAAVTIKTDVAEIKLDTQALAAVAEQAEGASVNVVAEKVKADDKEVRVELKVVCSEGKTISDFKGGNISVTVEAPKGKKDVVCVYIDEQGHWHTVPGQLNADGTYTFTTGHFSTYAIVDAEHAEETIAAQKEAAKNVQLKLRSVNTKTSKGKKAIKLTVSEVTDTGIDFDGYVIYRSTKKTSGYKKIYTTKTGTYYNTSAKKGVKYYYKAKGFVTIDGEKVYTGWSKKAIRTAK